MNWLPLLLADSIGGELARLSPILIFGGLLTIFCLTKLIFGASSWVPQRPEATVTANSEKNDKVFTSTGEGVAINQQTGKRPDIGVMGEAGPMGLVTRSAVTFLKTEDGPFTVKREVEPHAAKMSAEIRDALPVAMPTREERFYAIGSREIAENKALQGIWGKAVSLAIGDDQKAKALYISLRVDQLERDYQKSIADLLRESWAEIEGGKQFHCPYCDTRTTAVRMEVDFFVDLFRGASSYRYRCQSCRVELRLAGLLTHKSTVAATGDEVRNSQPSVIGLILGLLSIFLYYIGIIPILAIIFSGYGLANFDDRRHQNLWMGIAGMGLGLVYTIMMLDSHGHLK